MAEAQKDNDQSMDDILASIRKIISEDGTPVSATTSLGAEGQAAIGAEKAAFEVAGQVDDLSDIFEQSGESVKANALDGGTQSNARAGQSAWRTDSGDAAGVPSSGSLTDKLASLDGAVGNIPAADEGANSEVAQVPSTSELVPGTDDVGRVESSPDAAVSLEETLENVRKVAAGPAAVQPLMVEPSPAPEAGAVDSKLAVPSHDIVSEAPSVQPEIVEDLHAELGGEASVRSETAAIAETTEPAPTSVSPASSVVDVAALSGGASIETLVTLALKPMLQQWLDANLPQLVEEKLQEELKRRVK